VGKNKIELLAFLQHVDLRNDTGKFVFNNFQSLHPDVYGPNKYLGLRLGYTFSSINEAIVPTKGFVLHATGKLVRNISRNDYFQNYGLRAKMYLPVSRKFSFAVNAGGETILDNSQISNNAQYYQHAVIGGPQSLRGYRLERFWGKTSFYNTNELRYITHMKSYFMNAKIGILAFFDGGRVWMPGEYSGKFHTSYGTGLLIAPFNKLALQVTYGVSPEASLVQLRLNTDL
jgi:outer membrane protein assembly factor BamA